MALVNPPRVGRVERALIYIEVLTLRFAEVYKESPAPLKGLWRTVVRALQVTCWVVVMVLVIGPLLLLADGVGLNLPLIDYLHHLDG